MLAAVAACDDSEMKLRRPAVRLAVAPNGTVYVDPSASHRGVSTSPARRTAGRAGRDPSPYGPRGGTIGLTEWWIDGSLAVDPGRTLYAAWDTQRGAHDTGWLAWSTNGGKRWSRPLRVASSRTEHLTEVAAPGRRNVYVGWQTIVRGKGYATFLRRYAPGKGWTGPAVRVSPAYGNPRVWPGDTFGISTKAGAALLSWGSAVNGRRGSDIYFSTVKLPGP